jgi:hypothetical protein
MEDFVTYEIAVKLKEKGFNERCLAYYTKDSDFFYNTSYGLEVEYAFKSFNSRPNHICGKRIDAPTISQVLKWLREEKHLHIHIEYIFSEDTLWICEVQIVGSYERFYPDSDFNSYEEAAITGIKYVLDNLI